MANWYEPDQKRIAEWKAWLATRPEHVAHVLSQFPPWKLYWLPTRPGNRNGTGGETGLDGHRVYVIGCDEAPNRPGRDLGVTLRVAVEGQFNKVLFERQVFGIKPSQLSECDLPAPGEAVGATLTPEEARQHMPLIRAIITGKHGPCSDPRCICHRDPETGKPSTRH